MKPLGILALASQKAAANFFYSCRKATMGSTRMARRAGM